MYKLPFIRDCRWIRAHIDSVPNRNSTAAEPQLPRAMVYEWMDNTLSDVDSSSLGIDSNFPQQVAREVLRALEVFHGNGWIHGDVHVK